MYGFVPGAANLGPMASVYPDVRVTNAVDRLRQDLGFAVRLLRRAPGLTAAIVLTLALGIGATAATFSVLDAVLLRPLAYADADDLVVVMHRRTNPVSAANFLDWQREATGFRTMAAAQYWTPTLGALDDPEKLFALHVSDELLPMLGVPPAIGRFPRIGVEGDREVVIADGLWRRRFGADRDVLGRTIVLDGSTCAIVGVMPPAFKFAPFWATRAELWARLDLGPRATSRSGNSLRVFARLAPGSTIDQARASISAVTAELERRHPGTNRDVTVTPLKDIVVGDVKRPLVVLFTAVWVVLLAACANVAHLLLTRAASRDAEIAVRAALGASRWRLVRQLLTESLLLAGLGGAAGLLLARWLVAAAKGLGATTLPRVQSIELDDRTVFFAAGLSALTALVFGLAPALKWSRPDLTASLRSGERGGTDDVRRRRVRFALASSEIAVAVTLLVGAALLLRSFGALAKVDPGFEPDGLVSMVVSVSGSAEGAPGRRLAFYTDLLDRLRALPGVTSASAINHVPLVGDLWGYPFRVEGRPVPPPGEGLSAVYRVILPRYFETMKIPLIAGREFTDDDRDGSLSVVIVSEHLAATHFPGESALGRRIRVAGGDWSTIVGITGHVVRSDWLDGPGSEVYLPVRQVVAYRDDPNPRFAYLSYVVHVAGDPAATVEPVRRTVRALAPSAPVSDVFLMSAVVADETSGTRFVLVLLGIFAGIAWLLAAVGTYGVMSHSVSARRREIGIRLALGASGRRVAMTIAGEGLAVTMAGVLAGAVGALALGDLMSGLLFLVTPTDAVAFMSAVAAIVIAAALACFLPARRAGAIDPQRELR